MLRIELIRDHLEQVKENLKKRNFDLNIIDNIYHEDIKNRKLKTEIQDLNAKKNQVSKEIGELFAKKENDLVKQKQNEVLEIKNKLESLEKEQVEVEAHLHDQLARVPNLLEEDVNYGKDENDNIELKKFSTPTHFDFEPLAHWDLANNLKLIDFNRAAKISGARFTIYTNKGARLFRALQQFTLDHNIKNGFMEILPPALVLPASLYGSGQLPKFKEDVYEVNREEMYLSPTAEVQLLNMHRDEIIDGKDLPILYTANTPCFRSEAGSAGRDTRGVIRQHQFWKSELVGFTKPEESDKVHEQITRTAETVLEELSLPYRRIMLCSGDTGFSSAKTYDIEVWLPSYKAYKEISSCSNCKDFQANRAKIRYKTDNNAKAELVHTLNGSSLAIDRLWAAVVENYQQKDGSIKIPEKLVPYMDGVTVLK